MNGPAIAIVGAACRYPDARTPAELWENVLAGRRAFRRIPPERLALSDYGSADRTSPDLTYGTQASVLEGYHFDRVRFRVSGATFRSVDLAHWLALDVADDALVDAGYPGGSDLPRATTAVLVGNTLTGEFSRASTLRLRWPYVRRVVDSVLAAAGEPLERRATLLPQIESVFKAPFAAPDGETLAGGLSNTIAGRICNYFNLNGGGYTVDGACASSLLALAQACSYLTAGDADVALAGGVDLSLDPFELVGFSRAGALASDDMRVYDAAPTGFWPGEGCGFVVLMREADAVAERRRIYAVIRGWGISSDGSGGLTRPELGGQVLALERAYGRAGFDAATVAYFEGHGTGTAVGDATELAALSTARRRASTTPAPAAIGSIKANIGHTKAAAGMAGLLKAMMAVHHEVLPPTCGCRDPHPALTAPDAVLRTQERAEPWPSSMPRRAGVSAMGFGGINVHVVLEGADRQPDTRRSVDDCARAWQDAELFLVAGNSTAEVRAQIDRLAALAPALSLSDLTDLAVHLQQRIGPGVVRVAIVASTPGELSSRLAVVREALEAGTTRFDLREGVFVGMPGAAPRIAFLFSGQAAPVRTRGGLWSRRFADVDELYRRAALPPTANASDTSVGQPAIVTASLAALRRLEDLGIQGDLAIGHSLGELTALRWSGALCDDESTVALASTRGRLMAELAHGPGAMAALATTREVAETVVEGTGATISGFNGARQITISGPRASVDTAIARARERGISATSLPVSYAFHSSLMEPVAPAFREVLAKVGFARARRSNLISTVTGRALTDRDDVRALLEQQLCSPVRFTDALEAAGPVDLFVELGPGHTLAALAASSTSVPAVSVDAAGPSLGPFLLAVGAAFALGAPVRACRLADGRFARPFDLDRPREFLVNPCELAPASCAPAPVAPRAIAPPPQPDPLPVAALPGDATAGDTCALLRSLVSRSADLPLDAIDAQARFLSDLHLNSITVAELLAEASRRLGSPPLAAPTDFADASLTEAARALDQVRAAEPPATSAAYPGVESWVRAFTIVEQAEPVPAAPRSSESGEWRIVSSPDHPLRGPLTALFHDRQNGPGTVVCMDPGVAPSTSLLLEAAKAALRERAPSRFVVVQQEPVAGGFARSLFLESGALDVCVVTADFADPATPSRVQIEACALSGFVDARYDRHGRRSVPVAALTDLGRSRAPMLGPNDVLLVTGGGKGIAAECALALARDWGVRLALIGRSRPENDTVLSANLDRMRAAGATVCYEAADVGDASAVRQAVARLRSACGEITAVLHAAGVNEPALIAALDERAIDATLRPKVDGAQHVLDACDASRLRLFVTFGSIIARTGLRGEAHYALANERLREFTVRAARELNGCRVLAIEWSVWSETGMGERLGRLEALARQGVAPIALDEGIALFKALLAAEGPGPCVIVTGRFGDLPTLRLAGPRVPFSRFLETPRVYYPGVELVADATLSAANDPYLEDHRLDGQLLFPAVMGLEAMVQAAVALRGVAELPVLDDVQFSRPVVVPPDAPLVLRTLAYMEPNGCVRVHLRSSSTGFVVDHFRATCSWEPARIQAIAGSIPGDAAGDLDVDSTRELYGSLLFQSGRFARVRRYLRLFATECAAVVDGATPNWFGPYLPADLLLGDAGARDAVLHCIQASVPHRRVVPTAVERILIRRPLGGACRVRARQRDESGDTFTWDLEVVDSGGEVLEQWQGLQLRGIASLSMGGLPAPLLGPYVERQLAALGHTPPARVLFAETPGEPARRGAGRAIADGITAGTRIRPDGKPEGANGAAVSAAHAGALTMAVTGPSGVGCDVEPVADRPAHVWRDLLGSDRATLADLIARERPEPYAAGATRVWAAIESLKKAGAAAGAPLVLDRIRDDGWVTLRAGRYAVSTWVAERAAEHTVALAVATGDAHAGV